MPWISRGSSLRLRGLPINRVVMRVSRIAEFANGSALARAHLFGRVLYRFYDVLVTGATTEVAGKRAANLGFLRISIALQKIDRRQDHSRRAIAALQAVFFPEAFLHGVQSTIACACAITDAIAGAVSSVLLGIRRKPFDGGDLRAGGLHGEQSAGFHRFAIEKH